jgi:hypothetical protein
LILSGADPARTDPIAHSIRKIIKQNRETAVLMARLRCFSITGTYRS